MCLIMHEVKIGIKYAFQTENEMTFAVSGTGHCAMETAICNVLEPDDKFLVASPGIWGDRALNIGQRLGAKCLQLKTLEDEVLQIKDLKKTMIEFQPNVVFLCHGDSSTGVLQPLPDIIDFLNSFNCIIIVDSVASLGAVPLFMDKWGIDVLYSGSQKILSAPPGISPICFNTKAVKKMKSRKTPISSFYMDALLLGNYWNCDGDPVKYHHTACMSVIYGLRESLSILAKETLVNCWERHKLCAQYLYNTLEEMGLVLFIRDEVYRLPSVTTVKIPAGIDGQHIVREMEEKYGICIAGGLGTTAGKVWRIGLMGYNCNEENIKKTCEALKKCIESSKLTSSL
ncbi:alanine--glyoxylate aminotransferase isoform X2 [Parasteatoda tepidariorum]|uniref:alanine--glyoxylate aminotransferase isoform X2 n=1 Tax=Parasteatoda tepidariorum TaxID=114398 RepID=UPI0039BC3B97